MKKLLALCLTAVLCLCCLASCGSTHKENKWFSEEKLTKCFVGDLPTITKDYVNHNDEDIYVNFTNSEFEAYAKSVYDYLLSQNYEYLGTRGECVNSFLTISCYNFKSVDALEDCILEEYDDSLNELTYLFVYSDGAVDEDGNVIFNVIRIEKFKEEDTVKNGDEAFKCNVKITFYHDREGNVSYVL